MPELTQISSDPFSRTTTVRETVPSHKRTSDCGNCGAPHARFRYAVQRDDSTRRPDMSKRPFCSIDCWRVYSS